MLALADSKTPPYGAAADMVSSSADHLAPLPAAKKLLNGKSVGREHSGWLIPAARDKRLDQDAGVLWKSAKPELATKFLHWLRTHSAAIQTISAAGYAL